jgi:hypothetical protein
VLNQLHVSVKDNNLISSGYEIRDVICKDVNANFFRRNKSVSPCGELILIPTRVGAFTKLFCCGRNKEIISKVLNNSQKDKKITCLE